jgi:acetyl-CoA acetyltransferase
MSDVLIVDGARTPMGGLLGDLADATANELGTTAIAATLERAGVAPEAVDEVFHGLCIARRASSSARRGKPCSRPAFRAPPARSRSTKACWQRHAGHHFRHRQYRRRH